MAREFDPLLDLPKKRRRFNTTLFESPINDFWESDDDDVVLFASQQAEESQMQPDSPGERQYDCQFGAFAFSTQQSHSDHQSTSRHCAKRASHQLCNLEKTPYEENLTSTLSMQEILGANESQNGTNAPPSKNKHVDIHSTNQWHQASPAKNYHIKIHSTNETHNEIKSSASKNYDVETYSTSRWAKNRQLAQERQLKFLMERVDVLQKENCKLQKELIEHNNQTANKDGEVCLLRDELRQARKLIQASKMEKIIMMEEAEKKCNRKVADVFKQVIAKNTELNFTNVEFSKYKIRSTVNSFIDHQPSVYDADECRNMLRMENLCITKLNTQFSVESAKNFYNFSKETRPLKKPRNIIELELESLLVHHAQLQFQAGVNTVVWDSLIISVTRVFKEFWSYAQTLDLPKHSFLYPYHHYDLQCDHNVSQRLSLTQTETLYKSERGILLRRYIATLALICQRHCDLSKALLEKNHGNYSILQIVNQAINKLSYSSEVLEHYGVIEACGHFLHSLLSHVNVSTTFTCELQLDSLFNLFKQLVFTRPNIWVFQKLSSCMLLCALHDQLMSRMCSGSNTNCFVSDRVRSVYRFGSKSCLIQVYASLLEQCFCSEIPVTSNHFKLLLSICENHVRFVFQCFTAMPQFVMKMHPLLSIADDEDSEEQISTKIIESTILPCGNNCTTNTSNTQTSTIVSKFLAIPSREQVMQESSCECYVKLCLSVVTLVFQMMYQWTLQDKKTHVSRVSKISQTSVHLLVLIFREYYLSCIFRDSEETTKHNLSLLCGWWKEYMQILNFQDTHVNFLKQLQELQFMLKPIHQESNYNNIDKDLADWKRIINENDVGMQQFYPLLSELSLTFIYEHEMNEYFKNLQTPL